MKLLVVDHNALDPANRVVYEKIVGLGGIELRLIVPKRWFNNYQTLHFIPPREPQPYELVASDVLFPSRTHRLLYLSLSKHLREYRPDVFYMNAEPENFQTFQAALLNEHTKAKFLFSSWRNIDHGAVGYPYKFSFLHRRIEAFVLKRATHAVVFNPTAVKLFTANGFDRVTFIPPAVDVETYSPRHSGGRSGGFIIGYVGRLVKHKGVDVPLHAFAKLPQETQAIIVGDGSERRSLMALSARLRIAERIQFRRAVAQSELKSILHEMDTLVLPSRTTSMWREQFGRVIIEAMAAGVPVIGSSSGEIPFVIGDAGIVFREDDTEQLHRVLEELMTDDALRARLREQGMARVRELFSLDVVSRKYHALLLSLAGAA